MKVVKNSISAPRWAKIGSFLMELGIKYNVEVSILYKETGLLTETVFYKMEGESEDLRLADKVMRLAIEEYNK